jgi:hypothetical protein
MGDSALRKRLLVHMLATAMLLAGSVGIGAVFFRQTSLPPSSARAQLWSVGITGEERYAGLTEPMMPSSTIFFWSAGAVALGTLLLVYARLTREP